MAAETQNQTVGRGSVFFDRFVSATNLTLTGERDFGNCSSFSINQAATNLDHYSSQRGLQILDKSVQLRVDSSAKFVCDNIVPDNLALWFLGEKSAEAQVDSVTAIVESITAVKLGTYYQIGRSTAKPMGLRNVSLNSITVENTGYNRVTAATASAAGTGLTNGVRTFTITDGTGTIAAVLSATVTAGAIAGAITVVAGGRYSVNPDTTANTAFTVDVGITGGAAFNLTMGALTDSTPVAASYVFDGVLGRIFFDPDAVDIFEGDEITVDYDTIAGSRTLVISKGQQVRGALRFIAENPEGASTHFFFPYVTLTSDGDYALIGDTWQEMSFTVRALKLNTVTEVMYADRIN